MIEWWAKLFNFEDDIEKYIAEPQAQSTYIATNENFLKIVKSKKTKSFQKNDIAVLGSCLSTKYIRLKSDSMSSIHWGTQGVIENVVSVSCCWWEVFVLFKMFCQLDNILCVEHKQLNI